MMKTTSLVAVIFAGAVSMVGCSHKTTNITPASPASPPPTTTTSSTTTTTDTPAPPPPETKSTTTTTTTAPTP